MARCQTHASLSKIFAVLLLCPSPTLWASSNHPVVGWDGREESDNSGGGGVVWNGFIPGYIVLRHQNKYIHARTQTMKSWMKGALVAPGLTCLF